MSMYWLYDLHEWQFACLTVAFFVTVAIAGLVASRPAVRRLLGASAKHNDVVNYVLAVVGILYGLAIGLLAVGTWEDFAQATSRVGTEAAALSGLYRELDAYPQPLRGRLENRLRDYTRSIIESDWPAQQRGESPKAGTSLLDALQDDLLTFEPSKEREKAMHGAVVRSLERAFELRKLRLETIGSGLPASLWSVVLVGAGLTIGLTYLFWVDNLRLHALLIAVLATFIGLLIFITATMDNPLRGRSCIPPDAYRSALRNVMGADR